MSRFRNMTAQAQQNFVARIRGLESRTRVANELTPNFATVLEVHSDRMTCRLRLWSGGQAANVPILTKAGANANEELYGELDLPNVDDVVLVLMVRDRQPVVIGTIIPYLRSIFSAKSGKPIGTANKAFTKKLLEENQKNTYRRIWKSGTTLEIQEDGSVIIETPSGALIHMDENATEIHITDSNNNAIDYTSSGITITGNSNTVSLEAGKVVINGNLEVDQ